MLAVSLIWARASTWSALKGPWGSESTPSQTEANSSRPPSARPKASRKVPDALGSILMACILFYLLYNRGEPLRVLTFWPCPILSIGWGRFAVTGGCCPPHGPGRTSAGCTRRPAPAAQRSAGRRRFCSWGASFRGFVVQDKGLTGGRALEHQL